MAPPPRRPAKAGRLRHTIYGLQTIKKMVYLGLETKIITIFMVSKPITTWQISRISGNTKRLRDTRTSFE